MATILPVPESEQRVLDNLLRDLNEAYPDKVIVGLQKDPKKWSEKVGRLYKNIGYASREDFLAAYGFTVEKRSDGVKTGRPSIDLNAIVEELISRYEGDRCVTSIDQLKEENPDLAPKFKSIQNKSKELFGMTFNNYLKEKGVYQSNKPAAEDKKKENQREAGLIAATEKKEEKKAARQKKLTAEEMLEVLKKRYDGRLQKPINSDDLAADNMDLSIGTFYKRLKEDKSDAYLYLLDAGIFTLFRFRNGMTRYMTPNLNRGHGISRIEIPHGTVGILQRTFFEGEGITEIVMPDTVKYIGSSAFGSYGLKSIKTLRLGNGVKEIGCDMCGPGMYNLKEIIIPEGVERINGKLFAEHSFEGPNGCHALEMIHIEGRVKAFAADIFEGIPDRVEIDCPEEMKNAVSGANCILPESSFEWNDAKNEYECKERGPFSEDEMIAKYGTDNDDPFEDVELFDDADDVEIEDRDFCFSGVFNQGNTEGVQVYLEYIVNSNGGRVKQHINSKTDYLIADRTNVSDRMRYNAVRYRAAFGKLKILEVMRFKEIAKKHEPLHDDDKTADINTETINKAVALYKKCIKDLDNIGADNRPIVESVDNSMALILRARSYEEKVLIKRFMTEIGLEERSQEKISIGIGTAGTELPVAVLVAQHVICGHPSKGEITFARDKWEFRGDYSSATRPAFRWTEDESEWKAFLKKGYKKFSNM